MEKITLWQTWDYRLVEMDNMSHQHLSNIHFYMNLIRPRDYPKSQKVGIREMLFKRFDKILPYRPDPNFIYEREMLFKLGYLRNNIDIVVDNQLIGNYER